MIISRVKAGCFMVSGSIVLLGLAAILTDDSLPETKAAALTPFQNLFFIVSILLMVIGIYFVLSSKTCPMCGEKVIRSAAECRYCGTMFKVARQASSKLVIAGIDSKADRFTILMAFPAKANSSY